MGFFHFMLSGVRHFLMALWSILCITSSIVLMVILFNRKIPLIMARTIWAPGVLFFAGVKMKINGLSNVDWKSAVPKLVISNHLSYLDIPSICYSIPLNLYWTAKVEIKKMPFVGWYMMATGMIFIDRSNKQKAIESMKEAGRLIQEGKDVFIFPEGRRKTDQQGLEFKKGAFHLALASKAEIIPVFISGTDKVWSKKGIKINPGKVSITVGNPIKTDGFDPTSIDSLRLIAQERVMELDPSVVYSSGVTDSVDS